MLPFFVRTLVLVLLMQPCASFAHGTSTEELPLSDITLLSLQQTMTMLPNRWTEVSRQNIGATFRCFDKQGNEKRYIISVHAFEGPNGLPIRRHHAAIACDTEGNGIHSTH